MRRRSNYKNEPPLDTIHLYELIVFDSDKNYFEGRCIPSIKCPYHFYAKERATVVENMDESGL